MENRMEPTQLRVEELLNNVSAERLDELYEVYARWHPILKWHESGAPWDNRGNDHFEPYRVDVGDLVWFELKTDLEAIGAPARPSDG